MFHEIKLAICCLFVVFIYLAFATDNKTAETSVTSRSTSRESKNSENSQFQSSSSALSSTGSKAPAEITTTVQTQL